MHAYREVMCIITYQRDETHACMHVGSNGMHFHFIGVTPVVQHLFSDFTELKPQEVTQILEEIKINRNLVSLAGVLLEGNL